ncbi:MAG TPA: hypothetical protein VKA32_02605, partial [Gammaproteobacteria bacterium]|nr:hypothetical protein [Gammaproteobacteria bacterium]
MPRPSVRLLLPLVVLLFTAVTALISYAYHSSLAEQAMEQRALSFVRRDFSSVQRQVEYLSNHGETERIQSLIGPLGENTNLLLVLVLNGQGRVLGSLHRWQTGKTLQELEPRMRADIREFVKRRSAGGFGKVRTSDIHLSPGADQVRAIFPIELAATAGEIHPSHRGCLVTIYDVGPEKRAARASVGRQTLG